jgi:hypothetical protein
MATSATSLTKQVAGSHYKAFAMQPIELITRYNIPFCEGNVLKYVCRHKYKDGVKDLEKARHYVEFIEELDFGRNMEDARNPPYFDFIKSNGIEGKEAEIIKLLLSPIRERKHLHSIKEIIDELIREHYQNEM